MRLRFTFGCLFAVLMIAPVTFGQDTTSAGSSGSAAVVSSAAADVSTPAPNAGQLPDGSQVRELGTANFLTSNFGLWHWGPLSMGSAEIFQAYGFGSGNVSEVLTEMRSNMVAQHRFGRNNYTFQYSPTLTISNGQVIDNLSNQDSSLDTFYLLTPRLGLALNDHFQIFDTNYLDGTSFFSADAVTSQSEQNAFLQSATGSRYLTNSAGASLSYSLSATTHVSIAPTYTYSRVTGISNPLLSNTYGASINLMHAVSATKSIGAYYGYETIHIEQHGGPSVTPFDNAGITYSQQLTPTWGFTGSFGAFEEGLAGGSRWSGSGNASTTKSFGKSSVALAFFRGQGLAGVITNDTTNRVDLIYRYPLTRKMRVEVGTGYLTFTNVRGLYNTVTVNWDVRPNMSWYASASYKDQHGDGNQIGSLTSNFIMIGLRWHPRRAAY